MTPLFYKNYLCIGLILLFCLIRLVVSAWIPVYPNTDYIITFPQLWGNATGLVILNVKSSQNMQRWVHILRLRPLLEVLLWDWLTDLGTDLNMCTHQHVLVLFSYHGALHQIFSLILKIIAPAVCTHLFDVNRENIENFVVSVNCLHLSTGWCRQSTLMAAFFSVHALLHFSSRTTKDMKRV